ncbi:MAG TPA: UDP-glucose/GDP-mannose dehydrogenase family protein [Candidatus Omnitrophota bacterium]|nr:UDP-glucose/GDP-mannose dehydrogenase family protein [Candidatus Omnitrophota bacterium]HPT38945.1 UDP-glucose/GDP-mannose dehydrogenase family protein [Candidatus Omnitrophota bacterium]
MNISIIGSGHVGLVSGACFAELGNQVICADNDVKKIAGLKKGVLPIYEPGLEELITNNLKNKRIKFTSSIPEAVRQSEIIFIAVGTPTLKNGEVDLTGIENVAREIAQNMDGYRLIVEKSTVPVETCAWIKKTILTYNKKKYKFDIVSNPEFLREGSAINDFNHPDRVVLGVETTRATQTMTNLYQPLNRPVLVTNIKSAELIKHASNAFLAAKISFVNALACICDLVGADVKEVAGGMGLDNRIGRHFLHAGIGYGGSCFPKDLDAFIGIAEKLGYDFQILKAVRDTNREQKVFVLKKIKDALWIIRGKTIAVLGLAFKPDTDDLRNSPSLDLIELLIQEGAKIKVYDPQAMEKARKILKKVVFCKDAYQAASQADCLIVATEWNEFKELDFMKLKKKLKRALIVDGRNIYDSKLLTKQGFTYIGVGSGNG